MFGNNMERLRYTRRPASRVRMGGLNFAALRPPAVALLRALCSPFVASLWPVIAPEDSTGYPIGSVLCS
jgi:hypothetical protein